MSNGLEAARMLVGSGRPPGIAQALDFTLWSVDDGVAVCGGTIGTHALNPMGFVHGGYISALLDTACGFAVASKLQDGQSYTSIDLQVAFHKALKSDAVEVHAEGRVISLGRKIAFARAELVDHTGRLLASASSSLLIL